MTMLMLAKPFLSSFARRMGKSLTTRKRVLVDQVLPTLDVTPEWFHQEGPCIMEIGFGGGEHLASQAGSHPHANFIGCEPFMNGVASLLVEIEDRGLNNIRIWQDDARLLIKNMPDNQLDQVYILFPDPWPKQRHHKRRLINAQLLTMLSKVMKPQGVLLIATDHQNYASWIGHHLAAHPSFTSFVGEAVTHTPPEGWVETRYQQKAVRQALPTYYFHYINEKKS